MKKKWVIVLIFLLVLTFLLGLTDIVQLNGSIKQLFTTSFFILLGTLIYMSLVKMRVKKCDRASRDLSLKNPDEK